MSKKYYLPNLMLLNFCCQIFSEGAIFFIDEKHTQQNLDVKVKLFHEKISFFMKENFHSVSFTSN